MCEWDLTIKPDLIWLSKNYPEIRIETHDWTKDMFNVKINESLFEQQQHYFTLSSLFRIPTHSTMEKTVRDKGKTVASIFGIDHPSINIDSEGYVYINFNDVSSTCFWASLENQSGQEYFYWTPDMPIIVFEQAYQIMLFLQNNRQYINIFKDISFSTDRLYKKIPNLSPFKIQLLGKTFFNTVQDRKNRLIKIE